jgi:glucose/arabinose dehydrogenase
MSPAWNGRHSWRFITSLVVSLLVAAGAVSAPAASAATLPSRFTETVAISGLVGPSVVRFSPDGRVFVAERSGLIKVFSSLSDTTADIYADLQPQVMSYWDRGLLGMALDPNFPTKGSIYVLYTLDAPIGGAPPVFNDNCADPTGNGCVVGARLSRIAPDGSEQVMIEDWCQQFPSHSIGSLNFGPDGALYVSGGDGASWIFADYGQSGSPLNPCGDPPGPPGTQLSPPTAEGGALRSQDVRTTGDPTGLNGAILRINPDTAAGLADNPFAASGDANARRIVAYGLRNPFRTTFRPGTGELWIGEVGLSTWEEIDRVVTPADTTADNFGWPCYEGAAIQPGYDAANLNMCETLYAQPNSVVAPHYYYRHSDQVVPGESCPIGGSAIAGLAFNTSTNYPAEYQGALFFADYSRRCIWVMERAGSALPSPSNIKGFVGGASAPVNLEIGPGGDLFYVDIGGTVRRISYTAAVNKPPVAVIQSSPGVVEPGDTVSFDGRGSSDPEGKTLRYAWDLDGDGAYDDGTASTATFQYPNAGMYNAALRVTDPDGSSGNASKTIGVGLPKPVITVASTPWSVGDVLSFSGSAKDYQGVDIPSSGLSWTITLLHGACPDCHEHQITTLTGSSGTFVAPDHEYPSSLQLRLTATDSRGLKGIATVTLQPKVVNLLFQTSPTGLQLSVDGRQRTAPFTVPVIARSQHSLIAPSPQTLKGRQIFQSWSDGLPQNHNVKAGDGNGTYTATYVKK